MPLEKLLSANLCALLLLATSCSVYTPMQCAAPAIKSQGETEIAASWSLTNRVEVGATYSPAAHLLVRGAASVKASLASSNYAQAAQYELALGTYWPLGQRCLVGGLAGFGQATAQANYEGDGGVELHLFGNNPTGHDFAANYRKQFGEAYFVYQPSPRNSFGLAYRLVQLRLTDATDNQVALPTQPILRSEPMFFYRVRPGATQQRLLLQAAIGASTTPGFYASESEAYSDPARQFKLGRTYMSVGILFYPHAKAKK